MLNKRVICMVTNDLNQDQRMFRICNSLQKYGYEVTLVGRKKSSSLDLPPTTFKTKRLFCFFERGFAFYAEYNIRLFFYALTQRFSVLYAVDLDTIASAGMVSAIHRKPFVFDAHEHFTETPELTNKHRIRKIWKKIADFWIPKSALCFTVNESLAELLRTMYNKNFEYLYNVPEKDRTSFLPKKEVHTKRILYQGVLNEGRGLECLIAAMESLPQCELYIVGEGDLSDSLRIMASRSKASERIIFTGWKYGDDLKNLTADAWLGVNLLECESLSYYYSLANKFFDYVHAELPSLHMNFPEYRKIIDKYPVGLTIETLSADEICRTVLFVLKNPDAYQSMKKACIEAKKNFYWENEEKKLLLALNEICKR